jgi:hypothetical protein
MLQASTEHAAGMPQVPKCFELRLIFISREMYLESSAIVGSHSYSALPILKSNGFQHCFIQLSPFFQGSETMQLCVASAL